MSRTRKCRVGDKEGLFQERRCITNRSHRRLKVADLHAGTKLLSRPDVTLAGSKLYGNTRTRRVFANPMPVCGHDARETFPNIPITPIRESQVRPGL